MNGVKFAKAIDSGKNEIIVIAGELGSYGFAELKRAAQEALVRGVREYHPY